MEIKLRKYHNLRVCGGKMRGEYLYLTERRKECEEKVERVNPSANKPIIRRPN
jgi:hypothetical protein